ncbi:MAG: signal recognition particle receptor subunit alpha, partial [Ornithinibacter sp.]
MSAIDTLWEYLAVALGILVIVGGIALGLMRGRGDRRSDLPPTPPSGGSAIDVDTPPEGAIGTLERPADVELEPELEAVPPAPEPTPTLERPEAPEGRLRRLRARLARSNSTLGKGLLALLSRGSLDEEAWEEVEDTLLAADLGVAATTDLVD